MGRTFLHYAALDGDAGRVRQLLASGLVADAADDNALPADGFGAFLVALRGALKDNIHTTDMPTTGGALAFDGLVPAYEATLTRNLRDAGAIIIAKTTLTELADTVASGMPGIYSALAGYSMNPYDPRRDPRDATFDGTRHGARRVELRRRHIGEFLDSECRDGDVLVDYQPVQSEHVGRHQADGRSHQPPRRHSRHGRSGHTGPDGKDGRRRRHSARRPRGRPAGAASASPNPRSSALESLNERETGGLHVFH